jgi:hypothetical protein
VFAFNITLHDGPSNLWCYSLLSTTPIKIRLRMQRRSSKRSGMTFPPAIHLMLLTLCLELARHTECSQIQCVFPSYPLSDCPQVGADAVSLLRPDSAEPSGSV